MKRFMGLIDAITNVIGCFCLSILMIAILVQVIWRYVFNSPLSWPEEVASFAFLVSTYMGMSICMKNSGHLRITILPEYCPKLWKPLDILSMAANTVFFIICGWLGYGLALDAYESQMMCVGLPLQMWLILGFIPLSCIFITLQALRNLILLCAGGQYTHKPDAGI